MRERGVTRSKGPQARRQTQVRSSEDKEFAHGTHALPTELNSEPLLFTVTYTLN